MSAPASTRERFVAGRRRRARSRALGIGTLAVLLLALAATALMVGHTFYTPGEVWRVMLGRTVPGASFTVGELRLPRTALCLAAGAAFGLGGVTFQTMLRNPLASPDVIGITAGAGAAAVIAITLFHLDQGPTSVVAVLAALGTAAVISALSYSRIGASNGLAGTRLILIGIGVGAMLQAVTSYVLSKASEWDLPAAMRWLSGSVDDADWATVRPLVLALVVLGPVLLSRARDLRLGQFGDDVAAGLGVRVQRSRLVSIFAAVGLVAFATAAAGPISFVAFLAGPIAARLVRHGSLMVPAALVGGLLVLGADLLGQFAFDDRYPVGVVTGALGAPYLVFLLVRTNRSGGSL